MDLIRHLRFFAAVAEERHFGNAAAALGMTQPPLSQGIQRLERHLGVRLFERDARGVRITEAGSALLPQARELLDSAATFTQTAVSWSEPPSIRIGIAADLEERAPLLVAAAAAAGPVVPEIGGSVALLDQVRDGRLDVAVVRHPGVVDGTRPRDVHTLRARVLGDTGATSPQWRDIELPVAVPRRIHHPAAHDQLVDTLRRQGHSGDTVEVDDLLGRRALVASGRAVTLTLDTERGGEVAGGELAIRVRVVLPVPALRRSDVDHEGIAARIEERLP